MNNPFYRLPEKETFSHWKKQTGRGFVFSVKANRFITHMKKLKDAGESLRRMLGNASGLGVKLGPLLFQLPPGWKVNARRLEEFVQLLPKGQRAVFEFRDQSWYNEQVRDVLKKHQVAFCIYDLAGHRSPLWITAQFVYVRLHGPGARYQGSYDNAQLNAWARRCRRWLARGLDVFVYFDNDQDAFAAFNAMALQKKLQKDQRVD